MQSQQKRSGLPRDRFRGYTPRPVAHSSRHLDGELKSAPSSAKSVIGEQPNKQVNMASGRGARKSKILVSSSLVGNDVRVAKKQKRINSGRSLETAVSFSAKTDSPKEIPKDIPPLPKPKRKKFKVRKNHAFIALAVIVAFTVIVANVQSYMTNKTIQEQVAVAQGHNNGDDESGVTNSSGDVDETPISESSYRNYTVSPDIPKYIKISKLGVDAKVLTLGLGEDREIQSPRNIYNAGWYDGSNKPGEKGAVFIDGHVSGPSSPGIFYNLKNLNSGDVITVINGDGSEHSYEVVAKESVGAGNIDMDKVLRSYDVDKQGLNLMTCNGDFNWSEQSFAERQIVYSVKI